MSPDELGFLASICSAPDDDAPRLAFADWLDEHAGDLCSQCGGSGILWGRSGDGAGLACTCPSNGNAERAEFIRVQCELARLRELPKHERFDQVRDLASRAESDYLWRLGFQSFVRSDIYPTATSVPRCLYARGFVESITLTAADWLAHHKSLVWHPDHCSHPCPPTAQPILTVRLTTRPGFFYETAPFSNDWRDTDGGWSEVGHVADGRMVDGVIAMKCKCRWPWLTVELPPEPRPVYRARTRYSLRLGDGDPIPLRSATYYPDGDRLHVVAEDGWTADLVRGGFVNGLPWVLSADPHAVIDESATEWTEAMFRRVAESLGVPAGVLNGRY